MSREKKYGVRIVQAKFLGLSLFAALGGGAWFATAGNDGEYYDLSRREVASRLATAQFPGSAKAHMSESADLVPRVYKRGDSEVVWEFSIARSPLASFTASLEPEGEGTRVSVDLEMADNKLGEAAVEDMGEGREFIVGVLEMAMEQHVDATLTGRKFDDKEFAQSLATYALSNPAAARKYLRRMQELHQSTDDPAIRQAVKDTIEAEAAWQGDTPMLDTSGADVSGRTASGHDPEGFDPTPPKGGW